MKKSKCCNAEVEYRGGAWSDSGSIPPETFCSKCGSECEVIEEEEEVKYFDKEPNGDEKCRCGHIVKECYYNQTNGEKHQRKEREPLCSHCYSFPSDTFIESKIEAVKIIYLLIVKNV